jgi:hypothetical protein
MKPSGAIPMRAKAKLFALAATLTILLTMRPASAGIADLLGDWRNTDPATRDVVRILISESEGTIEVHVWGSCHPSPCDWGSAKALAYAPKVGAALPEEAAYLLADFRTRFALTQVIVGPAPTDGPLQALKLTRFTDRSGRSDYATASSFTKSP